MAAPNGIRVAVVGATGYAGAEAVRLLARHPSARISVVTSEQSAGKSLEEVLPSVRGKLDLRLEAFDPVAVARRCDVALTALPHGKAAEGIAKLLDGGCRVVDIGSDFRLRDPEEHARVYGPHPVPELLGEAVYGLTEFNRTSVASARLVANPGCYPTAALLGLLPLTEAGLIEAEGIVVDAKSGVTGAGRTVAAEYLFAEVDDNLRAYKIGQHRHAPEIEQPLRPFLGHDMAVTFVPHLLPIRRGILSTAYVRLRGGADMVAVGEAYERRYGSERFIVLTGSRPPEIRDVVGTNDCAIGWTRDARSRMAVIVSVIDNLGKGAAGQAIQNLNVMMGIAESAGIDQLALVP